MINKIFVFHVQRLDIINMYLGLIYLSAENLYSYCSVDLVNKFPILSTSQFVTECNTDIGGDFRDIDWQKNIIWLDNQLACHDKHLTIGNRDLEQVRFLKNRYGDRVITTCFNYTEKDYLKLLTVKAEYHVSNIDKTGNLNYYIDCFDKQKLIPKEVNNTADVIVNISDLNDIHLVREYIKYYGFDLTPSAESYYNKWHKEYYE